jgi:hypothetical protein
MKSLTSDVITELSASSVQPIYLVEIDFADGPAYLWSGIGTVSWNGHSWLGVGSLGSISAVTEANEVSPQSITLTMSGIPSDLLAEAISECRQNTAVNIWFGFLNSSGAIIADPSQCFAGHVDVPTVTEGAETSVISITAENPLIDLNRSSNRRYTMDDQFIDYPTDQGFSFVPSIQAWSGLWGKAGGSNPTKSGGGGGSVVTSTPGGGAGGGRPGGGGGGNRGRMQA